MLKITPTPWSVKENGGAPGRRIMSNINHVADTFEGDIGTGQSFTNAEAIVNAVNGTYGAGIDPKKVKDLLEAAEGLMRFRASLEYWADNVQYLDTYVKSIETIAEAIKNIKLK